MDDMEVMRSAGLYVDNVMTGLKGFNLAAVLLFGKPEVIRSCVPGYKTDAIFRRENTDRYDDRDIVEERPMTGSWLSVSNIWIIALH